MNIQTIHYFNPEIKSPMGSDVFALEGLLIIKRDWLHAQGYLTKIVKQQTGKVVSISKKFNSYKWNSSKKKWEKS